MKSAAEQLEVLSHGIDRIVPEDELRARLETGEPLRVKLGLDPTAPDVHLGWAVVLDLLRRFQELGHTAVLIVGDFTAQVGDPSGRSDTRGRLSANEVQAFAGSLLDTIKGQLLPEPLEIRYNSEWLGSLDMAGVLDMTSQVTVAQMLERDDFSKRMAANEPVSLIEFLYPLLQGTDSVAVQADVELGGSDQLWNLMVGRQLQTRAGQAPQVAMTVPLLVGTDGTKKMSQSYGNYISVRDEPAEMFGKTMSIPDELMAEYFELASGLPAGEAADLVQSVDDGSLHPGEAKRALARAIVARHHNPEAAVAAETAFDAVFKDKGVPEEVPVEALLAGDPVWLPGALAAAGVVTSNSEGRRMVAQGAVKVDGKAVGTEEVPRAALVGQVVQVGKRRFVRFVD
ncbi:MAG: tyrosine--tRNA ligase [Acidimicrobiia bacterium]|nr:tyrosine--tRNA ligase [Acidimicrobiia bacterium]